MVLLVLCASLPAQRYHVRQYDLSSGMPSVQVTDIDQDAEGRMWFATRAGMVRYDGYHWETISTTPDGTPILRVQSCCSSEDGGFWAASPTGVHVRHNSGWVPLPELPRSDRRGALKISVLTRSGHRFLLLTVAERRPLFWNGKAWSTLQWDPSRRTPSLIHDVVASRRCFWIATDVGVIRFDPVENKLKLVKALNGQSPALGLCYDRKRHVIWMAASTWLGTLAGIDSDQGPSLELLRSNIDLGRLTDLKAHLVVQYDAFGGLWIGNIGGLFHLTPDGRLRRLHRKNGLIAEGISDIFLDREDNLWISGYRGLTKIMSQRFKSYDSETGLPSDEVTAIQQAPDGSMILGQVDSISILGPSIKSCFFNTKDSVSSRTMDMVWGPEGKLWIAGHLTGLACLEEDRIRIVQTFPGEQVNGLQFDSSGTGWLATTEAIYRCDNGKWQRWLAPAARKEGKVGFRRLVMGQRTGTIYAASTLLGVVGIRDGLLMRWEHDRNCTNVFTVLEDSKGRIWSGSLSGLCRLIDGRFTLSSRPRIQNIVYSLLEDSRGRLWIGVDDGVFRWDESKDELVHFKSSTGIVGAETNRGALFEDNSGQVWIGTDRGATCYNPDYDMPTTEAPIVALERLEAYGRTFPLSEPVILPSSARTLTIEFSASSFVDEERVLFRTKLEPLDKDWSLPRLAPLRQIRYAHLPPGRYRFHLQAIGVDGQHSEIVTSPLLTIERPLYSRTWFVSLLTLLAVGLAWGGLIFWNQKRYARDLEVKVRLRTEQIRQIERAHEQVARLESLGLLAGSIAHDFNNLLTTDTGYSSLLGATEELTHDQQLFVSEIASACERARELTNQLLTFSQGGAPIREETIIQDLVREATSLALLGSDVYCRFDIGDAIAPIRVDPQQMQQVIKNVVMNAREAMDESGEMHVTVRDRHASAYGEASSVIIEIWNDGPSIPKEIEGRIFDPYFTTSNDRVGLGLAVAHSIMRKHGGSICLEESPEEGVLFVINLPREVST